MAEAALLQRRAEVESNLQRSFRALEEAYVEALQDARPADEAILDGGATAMLVGYSRLQKYARMLHAKGVDTEQIAAYPCSKTASGSVTTRRRNR